MSLQGWKLCSEFKKKTFPCSLTCDVKTDLSVWVSTVSVFCPEDSHHLTQRVALRDGTHVQLLLEPRRVVVDVRHGDSDHSRGGQGLGLS